jgi:uncharacterized protein (DUF1778 family)
MKSKGIEAERTRFDARLTVKEKLLFEKAASIAGYRTLTDFVLKTVKLKAKEIIEEHELVLASERDSRIFFNAILNPPSPNDKLKLAAKKYFKAT